MSTDQNCYGCQYRSRIDPKFCNNYMMPIERVTSCKVDDDQESISCKADNDRESILIQTRGRSWLTVAEIKELKRTAVEV